MIERVYVKNNSYTEQTDDLWSYLLNNLSDVCIIEETEQYIRFSTTNEAREHLEFLSDCDFGLVLKCSLAEADRFYPGVLN